ncbi:hypothetical protein [Clostridium uliginosum]|uniref:Methyltransferase domain-containing protein n=1 Tax=Clostridium uliginosum TaxID=119641 RepID=A0A1I1M4Y7_9CLOT|nr:hypothetical protein [Clostridium uliginosum]SFC78248.1 hypothetical protein SAMN05421842_10993 [Clostridium uliginosum]
MGKTLVINLEDIDLKGDILDVGQENFGVIYSISKEIEDELSLDYIFSENKSELKSSEYDACTFFFNLNRFWSSIEKEKLIKEVSSYVKENGEIFIWDINKDRGKVFNNKIKVILPNNRIKEFTFKNLNPVISSSIEEVKKIISKYFNIEEVKLWEDIFFIRAKKIDMAIKIE